MLENKRIAVVIPAYNEANLVSKVIETMPNFVDKIIVVDDRSTDNTVEVIKKYQPKLKDKLVLVEHGKNQGVGAAIISGYKRGLELGVDVCAVMAGDGQMDPADLEKILTPVVKERCDYAKGNRLFTGQAWKIIPKHRYLGNAFLSLLTKIASGYWHVADSQSGYTAISTEALKKLDLDNIYKKYGFPNDILVKLNVCNCRVVDIPARPVYNVGERSKIRLWKVVPTLSLMLLKDFFWRLCQKYIIRDFHPLIFFYLLGILLLPLGLGLGLVILYTNTPLNSGVSLPVGWIVLCALLLISGMQSLFFGMWFDMDYNRNLFKANEKN
ncbi:MAG: glycosyltransferase family 2 protein [Candidatus Omnitrophica bacterium]|nr:glycosyltransferase family 2 protein [Candidatus Omnitrophota bacterium]